MVLKENSLYSQKDSGPRLEAPGDINNYKKDHDVARIENIACYHVLNPTSDPEPTKLPEISSESPQETLVTTQVKIFILLLDCQRVLSKLCFIQPLMFPFRFLSETMHLWNTFDNRRQCALTFLNSHDNTKRTLQNMVRELFQKLCCSLVQDWRPESVIWSPIFQYGHYSGLWKVFRAEKWFSMACNLGEERGKSV